MVIRRSTRGESSKKLIFIRGGAYKGRRGVVRDDNEPSRTRFISNIGVQLIF
jgi:transcription elongation factor